jgi:hypothetical protein
MPLVTMRQLLDHARLTNSPNATIKLLSTEVIKIMNRAGTRIQQRFTFAAPLALRCQTHH